MIFNLAINKNIINKGDPKSYGWVNAQFDAHQLMQHILSGYAYSQGVLKPEAGTAKPNIGDIIYAELLSVDIDNEVKEYDPESKSYNKRCKTLEEGYTSLDSVMEDPWFHENALLIYTTPSHTEVQNRFRIVFLLPERINDPKVFSDVSAAFIEKFDSDKSCKNIDRMFYGHTNAVCHIFGKMMSKVELNRIKNMSVGMEKASKTYSKFNDRSEQLTEQQVSEMLSYIPKQMCYDEWGKIVSAVGNYFDESTAIRLIENWSPDEKQGTAYKVRHRSKKPTISSVIYYAAMYGYDKSKLYSGLSVSKRGRLVNSSASQVESDDDMIPDDADEMFVEDFDLEKFLVRTGFTLKDIFWNQSPKTKDAKNLDENESSTGKKSDYQLQINMLKFINFLQRAGYRKFWLDKNTSILVQVTDNIVDIINEEKILDSVKKEILKMPYRVTELFSKLDLIEVLLQKLNIYSSTKLLKMIDAIDDRFIHDSKDEAFFFFENTCVKATKGSVEKIRYKNLDGYIWKDQISNHKIKNIYMNFNDDEAAVPVGQFEQFIQKVCSPKKGESVYRKEREVDLKRYAALCSAIGYMLHTYKDPTVTKAVVLCEEKIARADESNGRTGKGVTAKAISKLRKEIKFNGKQVDFNDKFFYQMVSPDTQVLYFDDVEKNFNFEKLFSDLTEGISIQNKGQKPIQVPYEKSPKFLISTNSVLANDSDSHKARKFEIEYSDYFDASYQPPDEFGNMFFEEGWSKDSPEWDMFFSFMISCTVLYMNDGLIPYDQVNLEERKIKAKIPEPFIEFAEDMIAKLNEGEKVYRESLYENFVNKNKIYGPHGKSATTQTKTSRWFNDYLKFKRIDFFEGVNSTRDDRRKYWKLNQYSEQQNENSLYGGEQF